MTSLYQKDYTKLLFFSSLNLSDYEKNQFCNDTIESCVITGFKLLVDVAKRFSLDLNESDY